MTPGPDAEIVFTAAIVLAQFEPDFDGTWEPEPDRAATAPEGSDDPQWIVWPDAADEAAWAAAELGFEWAAAVEIAARHA